MKELLEDPETIPFLKGTNINLISLKKEIDRRIVKIKFMLGQPSNLIHNQPQLLNIGCQTDHFQSYTDNGQYINSSDVLRAQHALINIQNSKEAKVKYTGRCSLPVSNNRERKKQLGNDEADNNKRIRVS